MAFFSVMERDYDGEKIKQLMKTTGISHIFLSKSLCCSNPRSFNSLAGMIVRGVQPDWISVMKIPAEFRDVILAKVDGRKLRESQ
jgi:hypothetical protein